MSLRSRLGFTKEPLYLMDGSAFVYRGFYAFQNMARSDGFPTNALYIVARLLLRLIREEQPKYFAFILDGKEKSFRHATYDQYKAQRSATPEPLVAQFAPIMELLEELGIPCLSSGSYEADDYIASLARTYGGEQPVVIIGADKDLKQCLSDNVVLWDPAAKDEKLTTYKDFIEETGMQPESWPDYQALKGDSSDNIPGVPKVGPKTAIGLMAEFPTLEALYGRLAAVPPKIRAKLEGHEELAKMCRELTRLRTDACPDITLDAITVRMPNMDKVEHFMQQYELRSLAREVSSMQRVGMFGSQAVLAQPEKTTAPLAAKTKPVKKDAIAQPSLLVAVNSNSAESTSLPSLAGQPTTAASKAPVAVEQVSLFGMATVPAAPAEYVCVNTVEELPKQDEAIALLLQPEGLLLASANWQRLYIGDIPALTSWLQAGTSRLVTADVKALYKVHTPLQQLAVSRWFDLSLAAYLISPEERSYSWDHLQVRFGEQVDAAAQLNEQPALFALAMATMLSERLQGLGLVSVFTQLELPLVPVLLHMEKRGIAIDEQHFSVFLHEVQARLETLTQEIYTHATRTFNIRSSQQLGDVLFSVLELPKAGKTKGGAMSTSQEALEKLQGKHPIIDCILEFRTLEKLRSTYLEPLPRLADASQRIHTTFNQMATATGRLSSSNPNLQNIPIRGQFGGRMRGCFVAAAGNKLVCADYSQIELRVLAHLSQDPTLLDAFHNNQDIHSKTAAILYDVPVEAVTSEQRRNAKTINFGLIYGMGAQKLAQELDISMKEAKAFMEKYFEKLVRLKEFYDAIENDAKDHGFVATMAGRRRLTPDITSANAQMRSQARRQAINTRIQGSAADVIKLAMIAVEHDTELAALNAKLILQVHDELILEVPAHAAEAAGKRLATLMQNVAPGGIVLDVPLVVDCGIGDSWAEAH